MRAGAQAQAWAVALAVVALAGCGAPAATTVSHAPPATPSTRAQVATPTARAAADGSTGPTRVIPLPTQLPPTLTYEQALPLFEYDRSRAFDVRDVAATDDLGGVTVRDITFERAAGGRLEALLVVPAGNGPFGGVLYIHGALGSSSDFLDEAVRLARHGVVGLCITYPEMDPVADDPNPAFTSLIYEIRELRRSLDLLQSQPGVDGSRLAVVAHSFGSVRAAVLAAVERQRLKTAILSSFSPTYGYAPMASFDPIAWVPYISPAELIVQLGTQDTWFTHDQADSMLAAAHEPKRLVWYQANHGLDQQAVDDRIAWLTDRLGTH